ncbi:MAG: transposase, partial [Defluviicoccus sp.]
MDKPKRTRSKFSSELRERAARMVLDQQAEYPSRWAALTAVAAKIGCTPATLRLWVAKAEGKAQRSAAETDMVARLKALERENRELRQANEILRKASA